MARRRYRSDALSSAAKTRPDQPPSTPESYPLGSEPTPPAPAAAPDTKAGEAKSDQPAEAISSLKAQIDAQRAYQQQQQPRHDPLAMYLASIPGLSPHKFYFLHAYFSQHPDRLNQEHWNVIAGAHQIARQERNIPEDSSEYFGFLHSLLNQQAAASPPHQPAPAPPPVHEPVPPTHEPEPEHVAHIDIESEHSGSGEPEESHMPQHFSAPVSRGSNYAIEHEPTAGSIRLSAEQRDMAARSGISETEYAKQLLKMQKMQKMQKSGLIK